MLQIRKDQLLVLLLMLQAELDHTRVPIMVREEQLHALVDARAVGLALVERRTRQHRAPDADDGGRHPR